MSTEHALRFLGDVAVRQGAADAECDRWRLSLHIIDTMRVPMFQLRSLDSHELAAIACAYAKGHHHA